MGNWMTCGATEVRARPLRWPHWLHPGRFHTASQSRRLLWLLAYLSVDAFSVEPLPHRNSVAYFAYGANMSTEYLRDNRCIEPLQSTRGQVYGMQRTFTVVGPNWLEPHFANLAPADSRTAVAGVLHTLTAEQWQRLLPSESSYTVTPVTVVTAYGRVAAQTLIASDPTASTGHTESVSRRYQQWLLTGMVEFNHSASAQAPIKSLEATYVPGLSEGYGALVEWSVRRNACQ